MMFHFRHPEILASIKSSRSQKETTLTVVLSARLAGHIQSWSRVYVKDKYIMAALSSTVLIFL